MIGPLEQPTAAVEILVEARLLAAGGKPVASLPFTGQKVSADRNLRARGGAGQHELPPQLPELRVDPLRAIRCPDLKITPARLVGIEVISGRCRLVVERRAEERNRVRHGRKRYATAERTRGG